MAILINAYATRLELPPRTFAHELHTERGRDDAELGAHLEGFVGYVLNSRGGQMTQTLFHVMLHLRRVRHHVSLSVEQGELEAFGHWAASANAICFLPDGSVRDAAGALLVDPAGGDPDEDAELPYPNEAQERKERITKRVEGMGIELPESLPPVVAESEVELRKPWQVARRAQALFAVAVRAESIAGPDEAISAAELRERMPHVFDLFTPAELEFVMAAEPSEQQVFDMAWRYEALFVLLYGLDVVGELGPATGVCDVASIANQMLGSNPSTFPVEAQLRPVGEILDALDESYRLHWSVRDVGHRGEEPKAGLVPGVVLERHYALNWLVQYEGADWDDVDTPT